MSAYTVVETERSTLEIAVHPDGAVVVRAPVGCPPELIEARLSRRSRWIETQKRFFAQFRPRTPLRQYLSGESHLYLGKHYRLKLSVGERVRVRLLGGFLVVEDREYPSPVRAKELLEHWYRDHAQSLFRQVLDQLWSSYRWPATAKPALLVRRMTTRWASLAQSGRLSINPDLVRAPLGCIEYVICHELCHLLHHDHGKAFFRELEERVPDWQKWKHRLELTLA